MKRLFAVFLICWASAQAADLHLGQYSVGVVRAPGESSLPYRIYRPTVAAGVKLPLLLLLHSITERGSDNLKPYRFFAPFLSDDFYQQHPSVIVIPQCPHWKYWWDDRPFAALNALVPSLLRAYPEIDPARVYVTGASLGGYAVYALLGKGTQTWAAAAPIAGDPTRAKLDLRALRGLPLWIFHGAKDPRVPVEGDRLLVKNLKAIGGHPKYTEYPEGGHTVWRQAYADPEFWNWLFCQHQ